MFGQFFNKGLVLHGAEEFQCLKTQHMKLIHLSVIIQTDISTEDKRQVLLGIFINVMGNSVFNISHADVGIRNMLQKNNTFHRSS